MRLRPGRNLELDGPVDGRDLDRRAERGKRRGDVDRRHQIVPVADEPRVLAHAHEHVQVARGTAALAGVAAPGDPDPLAVGDPGGDVDRHLRALDRAPAPAADLARVARDPPLAVADVAHGAALTIWPNGVRETARS